MRVLFAVAAACALCGCGASFGADENVGGGGAGAGASGGGVDASGGASTGGGAGVGGMAPSGTTQRVITIAEGVVRADLVDFPLAVTLRSEAPAFWFTTPDGEALAHEVERFDAASGDFAAWVRVPLVSATMPTEIIVHFGEAGLQETPHVVWEGHAGVWHLDAGSGTDSTVQGNHASGVTPPVAGGGIVGGGALFTGTEMYSLGDPADGSLDPESSSFSYELWVNVPSSLGSYDMPWHKGGGCAGCAGYDMELGTNGWSAWVGDGTQNTGTSFGIEADLLGRWSHLVVVVDREANEVRLHLDGALGNTTSLGSIGAITSSYEATLGHPNYPFNGRLDEVRVRNAASSEAWVAAVYANASSPDTFYTVTTK